MLKVKQTLLQTGELGLICFRVSVVLGETRVEKHVDGEFIEPFGAKFASNSPVFTVEFSPGVFLVSRVAIAGVSTGERC